MFHNSLHIVKTSLALMSNCYLQFGYVLTLKLYSVFSQETTLHHQGPHTVYMCVCECV